MSARFFPAAVLRRQTEAVLMAWGMRGAVLEATVDALHWADLSGIDSHGIALLHYYSTLQLRGRVDFSAAPREIQRNGVTAVFDAGTNLGHASATRAVDLACEIAAGAGLGAVTVRNSGHYGAAGYYAEAGAILEPGPFRGRALLGEGLSLLLSGDAAAGRDLLQGVASDVNLLDQLRGEAAYHLAVSAWEAEDFAQVQAALDTIMSLDNPGFWQDQALDLESRIPELASVD